MNTIKPLTQAEIKKIAENVKPNYDESALNHVLSILRNVKKQ